MRKLLGALAIAGMAVIFSAPGANAAPCWWNGYSWVCEAPFHAGWWGHHHRHWRDHRWARDHRRWHRWHRWDHDRPYAYYR